MKKAHELNHGLSAGACCFGCVHHKFYVMTKLRRLLHTGQPRSMADERVINAFVHTWSGRGCILITLLNLAPPPTRVLPYPHEAANERAVLRTGSGGPMMRPVERDAHGATMISALARHQPCAERRGYPLSLYRMLEISRNRTSEMLSSQRRTRGISARTCLYVEGWRDAHARCTTSWCAIRVPIRPARMQLTTDEGI